MKIRRYTALYVMLVITVIMIGARLVNLQVAKGTYYREKSDSRATRNIELLASRGEILDRNGRPIVVNRTGYNVYIFGNRERKDEQLNKLIIDLKDVMKSADSELTGVFPVEVVGDKYSFSGTSKEAYAWKKANGYREKDSAEKIVTDLVEKYSVSSEYSKQDKLFILATRINMSQKGYY